MRRPCVEFGCCVCLPDAAHLKIMRSNLDSAVKKAWKGDAAKLQNLLGAHGVIAVVGRPMSVEHMPHDAGEDVVTYGSPSETRWLHIGFVSH